MDRAISSILIIGAEGALAKIFAPLLQEAFPKASILAVDCRPINWPDSLQEIKTASIKYSIGQFNNLFANINFDAVFILGKITHEEGHLLDEKLQIGQIHMPRILNLCHTYNVKKVIFLSSFLTYGPLLSNHQELISEEFNPVKKNDTIWAIKKLQEEDGFVDNWINNHQSPVEVTNLRPCNVIGPHMRTGIQKLLLHPFILLENNLNINLQFIQEYDLARLILEAFINLGAGTFNLAPPKPISLIDVLHLTETKYFTMPKKLPLMLDSCFKYFRSSTSFDSLNIKQYAQLINPKKIQEALPDFKYYYSQEDSLLSFQNLR